MLIPYINPTNFKVKNGKKNVIFFSVVNAKNEVNEVEIEKNMGQIRGRRCWTNVSLNPPTKSSSVSISTKF